MRKTVSLSVVASLSLLALPAAAQDDGGNVVMIHKAIEKTSMPWRYQWYALVTGGEGGTYAIVLPRASFASFNPSGKPFNEMLEEAYGKTAADALLAKWREVVKGTEAQLTQSRPDLSYMPNP